MCVKRLENLWKKLKHDPALLSNYDNIIRGQLDQGVIEPVPENDYEVRKTCYLPHRPVIDDRRTTTKIRMVFDASVSSNGPSLNECLHPGPSLTSSLYGTLLRFCSFNYAVVTDIKQAFLQINLDESHRNYVRFIWFKDANNVNFEQFENNPLVEYRLCRVLFDVNSSPFLLSATDHKTKFLNFLQPILHKFFIQNITVQDPTVNTARICPHDHPIKRIAALQFLHHYLCHARTNHCSS